MNRVINWCKYLFLCKDEVYFDETETMRVFVVSKGNGEVTYQVSVQTMREGAGPRWTIPYNDFFAQFHKRAAWMIERDLVGVGERFFYGFRKPEHLKIPTWICDIDKARVFYNRTEAEIVASGLRNYYGHSVLEIDVCRIEELESEE